MSSQVKMNEQKGLKRKPVIWGIIIVLALISTVYYYNLLLNIQLPVHSDDAGSTIAIYDENIFGGLKKTFGNCQIFMIFSRISYALLGYSEMAMRVVFCMNFFCIMVGSLYLVINNKDRKIVFFDVVLLLYIVVLQGTRGPAQIQISKFHTNSTICFLLLLIFLQAYQFYKNKRYILYMFLVFLFSLLQLDYLLTIVAIAAPLLIYGFLCILHSSKCRKYLHYLILIVPCMLLFVRIIDKIYLMMVGKSMFSFSGWGTGRVFADIEEIKSNITLFFEGLLGMFNCNAGGTELISFGTVIWFIRFFILVAMLVSLIILLYQLVVSFESVDIIDGLLALSCLVTILAYMLTPQLDAISMRYCNVLLFALPILFLRNIGRKKDWSGNVSLFRCEISKDIFAAAGVFVLILGMIKIIPIERTHMTNDDLAETIIDSGLENGIGPYWAASVISLLTNETSFVQAVTMEPYCVEPYLGFISIYDDKCAGFNFVVEDREVNDAYDDNIFGISEKNIVMTYGKPRKQIEVGDDKTIYLYDYDIRTIPEIISHTNSKWVYSGGTFKGEIALNESVYGMLDDLEIGEYYAIIDGRRLGKETELLIDGEKAELVDDRDKKYLKFYFTINQFADENQFMIKNDTDHQIKVHDVVIQRIREAIDLRFDDQIVSENNKLDVSENGLLSDRFKITAGAYKIVIYGENIDDLLVETEGDISNFSAIEQGKERAVYAFSCSEDTDFQVHLSNNFSNNVLLTNVSVEMQDNDNVKKYSARQLWRNENTELVDGCIELNKNGTQYGPYVDLKKGVYRITVKGQNLDKGVYECYGENASAKIDLQDVEAEDDRVTYYIVLDRDMQSVECLVHNSSDDTVSIASCTIEKVEE